MSDPMSILNPAPEEPHNPYSPPTALDLEPGAAREPDVPLEPVGFIPRAGARIIDLGVHLVCGFVTGLVVGIATGMVAAFRGVPFATLWPNVQPAGWMAVLSGIVGSMLYMVVAQGWHGSSLGKLVLGIVVLGDDKQPCSVRQAWKRELAYFIDALFFGLIAASQMSKSPLKKRLGDDWADTVVAYRRSAPHSSLRPGLQFLGVFFLAALTDVTILCLPYVFQLLRT